MPYVEHPKPLTDAFYQTVFHSLFDAIYTVDIDSYITYCNAAHECLAGFSAHEIIGQSYTHSSIADVDPMASDTTHHRPRILRTLQIHVAGTWEGTV